MVTHLELAKLAVANEQEVWEFGGKHKDKLPLVAMVLKAFDKDASARIEKALSLPMTAKEMALGGRELMQLGLKGPQIGVAQKEIMAAIHAGTIENTPEDIEHFLQSALNK